MCRGRRGGKRRSRRGRGGRRGNDIRSARETKAEPHHDELAVITIMPTVRLDDLGHFDEVGAALHGCLPEQRGCAFARSTIAREATTLAVRHFEFAERCGSRWRIALFHPYLRSWRAARFDRGDAVARAERDESIQGGTGNDAAETKRTHAAEWNAASERGGN